MATQPEVEEHQEAIYNGRRDFCGGHGVPCLVRRSVGVDLVGTSRRDRIMAGQQRKDIRPGLRVEIVLKQDQRSGKRTVGIVQDVLTSAAFHSRGIKVRLAGGQVGRVQAILPDKT